jgi:anti-sigma28 factor (negative regulator of flagellin synthesis)
MAGDSDVRMDKVAEIQAALSSGSYNAPASAVASKVVDSMLGDQS